jgi:hypothetical protein
MSEQPEADAHIRALLAELGSGPDGEPMPPEVAARLDDTLARLVAQRSDQRSAERPVERPVERAVGETGHETDEATAHRDATVVPLRRRWTTRMATAAAAVIALGAGGVAAANLGVFGGDSEMTADSAGGASAKSDAGSGPDTAAPETARESQPPPSDTSAEGGDAGTGIPQISAASFAADVTTLLRTRTSLLTPERRAAGDSGGSATENQDGTPPATGLKSGGCPGPETTDGAVPNLIRYDGQPAVLVVHPESEVGRLVEAWTCAGDRRLATTTVAP